MTKWRIPLCDPTRAHVEIEPQLEEAFRRVLRSGRYVLGEEVEAFERECTEYLGVRNAIGVSSGTDALIVALSALGVGPGDEVICPTYTFVATGEAIVRVGAMPVLVDCAEGSFHIDPEGTSRAITPRTRAIIPVHLFGVAADVASIVAVAKARAIAVVEDAAQAFGVRTKGRASGTVGAIGCTSFFPAKPLGGFGDGGLVMTDDDLLASPSRLLRQHGLDAEGSAKRIGGNFRLDAMQAALLRVKLAQHDATLSRLASVARVYDELLASAVAVPRPFGAARTPYVVRISGGRRDLVARALASRGIETAEYYRRPLHRHEAFARYARDGRFPHADSAADECVALPCFVGMTHDEVAEVSNAVLATLR